MQKKLRKTTKTTTLLPSVFFLLIFYFLTCYTASSTHLLSSPSDVSLRVGQLKNKMINVVLSVRLCLHTAVYKWFIH